MTENSKQMIIGGIVTFSVVCLGIWVANRPMMIEFSMHAAYELYLKTTKDNPPMSYSEFKASRNH